MFGFIKKLFPSKHEKDVNSILPIVEEINKYYEEFESLSDEQIIAKTAEFKQRINSETEETRNQINALQEKLKEDIEHNERQDIYDEMEKLEKENYEVTKAVLDDILPEAFAVVKQTCKRLCGKEWTAAGNKIRWNMIPYDVQLIGGIVLHQGKISEMATGEGKTLVATLPMYLNALAGRGVHLITVNDYLAKRDSEWMGEIFRFHGLTVGVILNDMESNKRREMYNSDITYGTNNEFGFDYLRDNMVVDKSYLVQREHFYAIVDEVDSVLIDEARTPLIISGPVEAPTHKFDELNIRVKKLIEAQRNLVNKLTGEAEEIITKGNMSKDDESKAGMALLRSNHALPKHKKLQKLLSEPANKKLLLVTESEYLRDNAKQMHIVDDELYFVIDEKSHITDLTEKGRELLAPSSMERDFFTLPDLGTEFAGIENNAELSIEEKELKKDDLTKIYSERSDRLHTVQQLLKAHGLYEKDVDYVVQDGKVMIVDEFTGRILSGRRYSEGLHQAIEAKEGVHVEKDTQTLATITLQNYFRLYKKLAGMTGTAETESAEFFDIYKLDVTVIPTNMDCVRDDVNDFVYRTKREKYNAVIDEITAMKEKRRPVLVGTTSVDVSETISRLLKRKSVAHEVLNAKQHAKEAHIVENAGLPGAITIATNMAGRGTDIKLGPGVAEAGGLHIIGTERHESRRIDRQLRGRAGRQGDPGSSKFFLSLEDDLMRLFGSERIASVMQRLGIQEGEAIEHKMITSSVERAQKKVEENNFSIRKRLLEYDNVMNQQREVVYTKRRSALMGERLKDEIFEMVEKAIDAMVNKYYADGNIDGLKEEVQRTFLVLINVTPEEFQKMGETGLKDLILKDTRAFYDRKEERYGADLMGQIERFAMLNVIDEKWKEHLREMDDLKEGINFRAYGQKDPLLEYKTDGFKLFVEMLDTISTGVINFIFKFTTQTPEEAKNIRTPRQVNESRLRTYHESTEGMGYIGGSDEDNGQDPNVKKEPVKVGEKIGRNDPCFCGSGKKYKNCHGRSSKEVVK
ncbi:MAG: preprotein translocase subunit SecA [Ignavibacteria bacterium]|nr:preprotein translocase subunit SecA [Ignavibacteria bacterium]MBK7253319.1 preprotein translocase subunit SecA [Ignavibacteria bacterium]MBK7446589.1 preprotein translocase subunit SecA [Ignavibacteria bacterium]MBK8381151.1 preprotein translocase subunit SecA [Ignavibacteria bacterium]MBK9405681.1 preprotein translocase subunit SecA [Ignavibacteria bacterium]